VGLLPENELSKEAGVRLSPITGGAVVTSDLSTNVPGIFSCGNVLHVHDLADDVTLEAYKAGDSAAEFIKNGGKIQSKPSIEVKPGSGVRYVTPNFIWSDQDTELMFRSNGVYTNAKINVYDGDRMIKSIKRRIITPGEMEKIQISSAGMASCVVKIEQTSE